MTSEFGSFDASTLGAFTQSPGRARNLAAEALVCALQAVEAHTPRLVSPPLAPSLVDLYPASQLVYTRVPSVLDNAVTWSEDWALFYSSSAGGYRKYVRSSESVTANAGRELELEVIDDTSRWFLTGQFISRAWTYWYRIFGHDATEGFRFSSGDELERTSSGYAERQPGTCPKFSVVAAPCHRRRPSSESANVPSVTIAGVTGTRTAFNGTHALNFGSGFLSGLDGWLLSGYWWTDIAINPFNTGRIGFGLNFSLNGTPFNLSHAPAYRFETYLHCGSVAFPGNVSFPFRAWRWPASVARDWASPSWLSSEFEDAPATPSADFSAATWSLTF